MRVGKIISVEYDKFRVKIFHSTRNSSLNIGGQVYYFGNIGSYLKAMNSLGEYVLCEVVSIVDRIEDENKIYGEFNLDSSREIIIKPIGTLMQQKFNMGIGVFPSLYADVEIVTFEDLENVLMHQDNEKDVSNDNSSIDIGESKSLLGYKVKLDIDKFFNIHSAVLGNTGSGKSTTIARILQEIYQKKDPSARGAKTIIFDVNGEYPNAFGKEAKLDNTIKTIFYKPNINEHGSIYTPFHLPYYLMNLDEWLSFLMASERTQKPFWDSVLQECYKFYKLLTSKETSDLEKFTNYIKWKLYKMLSNISTRVDGDTAKMTAAKGVIVKIKNICTLLEEKYTSTDENIQATLKDFENFLKICDELCIVYFGVNNNSLLNALSKFIYTDDSNKKYVKIKLVEENRTKRYDATIVDDHCVECFEQIHETLARKVEQEKLKPGEYFDSKFLLTAIEIVLLEEEARGNFHIREFVSTLMSRLDHFLNNPECDFMRCEKDPTHDKGDVQNNNLEIYSGYDEYLEKVFGISGKINEQQKQLITIDASEVGAETLELMTTVISRMIFDYRKRLNGDNRRKSPVHLVLDEAHRYIHKDANYFMRENIFEKIAREGRKYAFYLIISSQRPSELSQTVLSQCGNYIVHRIQNKVDMDYVQSVLPYFSPDYVTKIKQAVPGEALIFGNCVPMPLLVKIKEADPTPNSENCKIREQWFNQQIENSAEETSQT